MTQKRSECAERGCDEPVAPSPEEIELGMPPLCETHLFELRLQREDEEEEVL